MYTFAIFQLIIGYSYQNQFYSPSFIPLNVYQKPVAGIIAPVLVPKDKKF